MELYTKDKDTADFPLPSSDGLLLRGNKPQPHNLTPELSSSHVREIIVDPAHAKLFFVAHKVQRCDHVILASPHS